GPAVAGTSGGFRRLVLIAACATGTGAVDRLTGHNDDDHDRDDDRPVQDAGADHIFDKGFTDDHFTGGEGQNSGPDINRNRVAVQQSDDERASPYHDRNADRETDNDENRVPVRGTGHSENVVDAHHRVGD